jgi:hypothetical protein
MQLLWRRGIEEAGKAIDLTSEFGAKLDLLLLNLAQALANYLERPGVFLDPVAEHGSVHDVGGLGLDHLEDILLGRDVRPEGEPGRHAGQADASKEHGDRLPLFSGRWIGWWSHFGSSMDEYLPPVDRGLVAYRRDGTT